VRKQEFFAFMHERESIRIKKNAKELWPWTDDPILQAYKFTNVKREHDRTTKWFWDQLDAAIHAGADRRSLLFNCALFRYFGTTEFFQAIGFMEAWDEERADFVKGVAKYRLDKKMKVFTGAYVITNQGIKAPKQEVVVDHFLTPFWDACLELTVIAWRTSSWEAVAKEMMKLKGFGGTGFMTKEILLDAIHTKVLGHCKDRNKWCPAGPGALRGLSRMLGHDNPDELKLNQLAALELMLDIFDNHKEYWPRDMVKLELHDIQFQLCEFDKYERVRLGQGRPRNRYYPYGREKSHEGHSVSFHKS